MFKFIKNYRNKKIEIELAGLIAKYQAMVELGGYYSELPDIKKQIAILEKKLEYLNK
jgi:hypothetical protein